MPKCSKDQIINPSTGRCVKKTGNIGKKILSMNANNYVDQALKKKTSTKKTNTRKASPKKAPVRKASAPKASPKKAPAHKASPKKLSEPKPTVPKKKDFDNVVVWVKPILFNPREDEFPVNDENIKLIAKSYKDHLTILDAIWDDGWKFKNVKINEDNRSLSINIEVDNIDHMDAVAENVVPIYDALNDRGFLMISDVWTYVMGAKPNLKLKDTHPEIYADLSKYNPEYLQLWGDDVNIAPGEWVGQRI